MYYLDGGMYEYGLGGTSICGLESLNTQNHVAMNTTQTFFSVALFDISFFVVMLNVLTGKDNGKLACSDCVHSSIFSYCLTFAKPPNIMTDLLASIHVEANDTLPKNNYLKKQHRANTVFQISQV